jgi:hypothetical protein
LWNSQPKDKWGITLPPSQNVLKLHKNLVKAESSIFIQLRTERIGLPLFLNKRRVPEYPTPYCYCGLDKGTVSHFLSFCPFYNRPRAFQGKTKVDLLSSPLLAKQVTKWAIKTGALKQFDLASSLLYGYDNTNDNDLLLSSNSFPLTYLLLASFLYFTLFSYLFVFLLQTL